LPAQRIETLPERLWPAPEVSLREAHTERVQAFGDCLGLDGLGNGLEPEIFGNLAQRTHQGL
jgi:hypothetical protein